MYPQRRAFFVPVLRTLSSLEAVTGLGVFWVAALKRDPRAPLMDLSSGTVLCKFLSGNDFSVCLHLCVPTLVL